MNSLSSNEKRALLKNILESKAKPLCAQASVQKPHERLIEVLSVALSDRELIEYGLDSIGMVQLEAELNSQYGVKISSPEWINLKTVKDLTTILVMKQNDSISVVSDNFTEDIEDSGKKDEILFKKSPGRFFWPTLKFFLRRFWPLEAIGLENIPKSGPFILCANHTSHLDTLIISSCLNSGQRRDLYTFSACKNFNNPVLRFFLKRLGGIAMDRSGDQRPMLEIGDEILRGGGNTAFLSGRHSQPRRTFKRIPQGERVSFPED